MRQVETFVLTQDGKRRETRGERIEREQREALAAQQREVARLRDWLSRLSLKETEHEDGLRSAHEAIQRHEAGITTTREKTKKALRDLNEATERLAKIEKAATR